MDGVLVGNEGDNRTRSGGMTFLNMLISSNIILDIPFHKKKKFSSQKKLTKGGRRPSELKNVCDILRKRINFMKMRKGAKR